MILTPGKRVWFFNSNILDTKNIRSGLIERVEKNYIVIVENRSSRWCVPITHNFFSSKKDIITFMKRKIKKLL